MAIPNETMAGCPCDGYLTTRYSASDSVTLNGITVNIYYNYTPPFPIPSYCPDTPIAYTLTDLTRITKYKEVIKDSIRYITQNYDVGEDLADVLVNKTSPGFSLSGTMNFFMAGNGAGQAAGTSICLHGPYDNDIVDNVGIVHEMFHVAETTTAPNGFTGAGFETLMDGMATFVEDTSGSTISGQNVKTPGELFPFNNIGAGWDLLWYNTAHYFSFLFDFWASQNASSKRIYESTTAWDRTANQIEYTYGSPPTTYIFRPLPGFEGLRAMTTRIQANQCANYSLWPYFDSGQSLAKCNAQSILEVIDSNTFNDWFWTDNWQPTNAFKRSWLVYADFNWWGDITEGTSAYKHDFSNVDVTDYKQKIITKYHPYGRTRPDGPLSSWFSEGFRNYQTGPITVIIRAACDYNNGYDADNLYVYIDGVQIGYILGSVDNGHYWTFFIQTNLTSLGWHSLEFRGVHTPTIQQVIVAVGNIDLMASYRPSSPGFDCGYGECPNPRYSRNVNLATGDYVVEIEGTVYHQKYNNTINHGYAFSQAWTELDGNSGYTPTSIDQGFTSLSGGYDNSPSGLRNLSEHDQYLTYRRAASRRIVTIKTPGTKLFTVKAAIIGTIDEAIVYPKPVAELFNMYFTTQSPFEIFYLHPVTRQTYWDNWINIQGLEGGGPGDVYASYTTISGMIDRYSNPSLRYSGPYNNPLVLNSGDYSGYTNYVFVVSAPEVRKNYKIIFN